MKSFRIVFRELRAGVAIGMCMWFGSQPGNSLFAGGAVDGRSRFGGVRWIGDIPEALAGAQFGRAVKVSKDEFAIIARPWGKLFRAAGNGHDRFKGGGFKGFVLGRVVNGDCQFSLIADSPDVSTRGIMAADGKVYLTQLEFVGDANGFMWRPRVACLDKGNIERRLWSFRGDRLLSVLSRTVITENVYDGVLVAWLDEPRDLEFETYLTAIDQEGNMLWSRNIASDGNVVLNDMELLATGQVLLAGRSSGTRVDGIAFKEKERQDGFVEVVSGSTGKAFKLIAVQGVDSIYRVVSQRDYIAWFCGAATDTGVGGNRLKRWPVFGEIDTASGRILHSHSSGSDVDREENLVGCCEIENGYVTLSIIREGSLRRNLWRLVLRRYDDMYLIMEEFECAKVKGGVFLNASLVEFRKCWMVAFNMLGRCEVPASGKKFVRTDGSPAILFIGKR